MIAQPYVTTDTSVKLLRPALTEDEMRALARDSRTRTMGWCLSCGKKQYNVKPNAKRVRCNYCEKLMVFGFYELFNMGLVAIIPMQRDNSTNRLDMSRQDTTKDVSTVDAETSARERWRPRTERGR